MHSGTSEYAPQAGGHSSITVLLVKQMLLTGFMFLLVSGYFKSCANYTTIHDS